MLSFSKLVCFSLAALFIPVFSFGQNCSLSFKGRILDVSTGIVLPFASVYDINTKKGVVADSLGYFAMKNLCPGIYRFQFRHIGCEMKELTVRLNNRHNVPYFPKPS